MVEETHLSEFLHVPVGQILELHSVEVQVHFYPLHISGISEQWLESWIIQLYIKKKMFMAIQMRLKLKAV